ncbi:MAG: choice-of-anchor I family protein [Actinomycetales bacterium]
MTGKRFRACGAALVGTALLLPLAGPAVAGPAAPARTAIVPEPPVVSADDAALSLDAIGTFESGVFDESASEIVAFHAGTQRTFVVNANDGVVQVIDSSDPTAPAEEGQIAAAGVEIDGGGTIPEGAIANSIAVRADGLAVVAVENPTKTDAGWLMFVDVSGEPIALGAVQVGPLPDSVAVSEDGGHAVVANEGEPADDFHVDPEGSISVVALPGEIAAATADDVETVTFHQYDEAPETLPEGVRVFGPQVPNTNDQPERRISQNLEPEFVSTAGTTAYVSVQEANAIAVVDIPTATLTALLPLGFVDHSVAGHGIDPSDRDPEDAPTFDIGTFDNLYGIPMPDAVGAYTVGDQDYIVTANEGDAREWGEDTDAEYVESVRAADLEDDGLGPVSDDAFPGLLGDDGLGRLNVSIEEGFDEETGRYEELYAFGSRSFSIFSADGELVFDSGEDFERITHEAAPEFFNSNHSESNLEGRSEDKGPEPEGLVLGEVGDRTYAFIGFERVGGVAVYDITDPAASTFVTYVNNRDFSISMEDEDEAGNTEEALPQAGDLGPEGLAFVTAEESPNGAPLLLVGNEVSGTTTFFQVSDPTEEPGEPEPGEPTPPTVGRGFYLNDGWDADAEHEFSFGRVGDEVLVGDWDGDGADTLAVRRGNAFFLSDDLYGGNAAVELTYGQAGEDVLVGDWDGDGVDSFAVRRGNAYFVSNSLESGWADEELTYGQVGDDVLVGDFDGDAVDTFTVRRGNTYFISNTLQSGWADSELDYGRGSDEVYVGDWDGDAVDTFAVRRGITFLVSNSLTSTWAEIEQDYGRSGDEVFVGDWNGDNADTLGIRR